MLVPYLSIHFYFYSQSFQFYQFLLNESHKNLQYFRCLHANKDTFNTIAHSIGLKGNWASPIILRRKIDDVSSQLFLKAFGKSFPSRQKRLLEASRGRL